MSDIIDDVSPEGELPDLVLGKGLKGQPIPAAEKEILARKIAAILFLDPNRPAVAIAKELSISRFQVKRITDSEYFRNLIALKADKDLSTLVNQARHSISKLLSKAVKVIEANLDKNSLEAAKIVLRSTGIEQMEEKTSDTTINVMLPRDLENVIQVMPDGSRADEENG